MDPQHSAQDVLRCDLCDDPVPPMYCDICHIKLCKACVGEHISDQSKEHKVVPFEKRGYTTKCSKHITKMCDLHCEECDIPICSQCISSGEHMGHKSVELIEILTSKKEIIRKDLQEIEISIYPKYQQAVSNILVRKADAREHCQKLRNVLKNRGEILHKEINTVIQKMLSEIDDTDSKHLALINKQEGAINHNITEIQQIIQDLRALLDSSDVCLLSSYNSRNEQFRRLPAQFQATLPTFTSQEINREQISQQLGTLTKLAITFEEHCDSMESLGVGTSSASARPLLHEPRIIRNIITEYGEDNELNNVSLLSDNELWTSGFDNIMRLYNLQGELLKSVQTKSGKTPCDIAVTQSRDLVYTDPSDRSINLVQNSQIQSLIRLNGWKPLNLCSTSAGGLLVTMIRNDRKQFKVVRYAGSTEKQSIQWDDQGNALYSCDSDPKYLNENKNSDICVADCTAGAVVVVSAAGKLRFRYTVPPASSKYPFKPLGITTDSQSRILVVNGNKTCIHILDQDGQFLRYIDSNLEFSYDLCVDSRDILFVPESFTGKVKIIQYYK